MFRRSTLCLGAALALAASLPVHAQTAFPATLDGHAVLPARTMISAPKDAPPDLQTFAYQMPA